jgi:hypothetical protein
MLSAATKSARGDTETDTRTFSLKPTRAPAGELLVSFAKAAGRNCRIDPAASEACRRVMTIEADQQTLRELIDKVAAEVGVEVVWRDDVIIVTAAPAGDSP